MLCRKVGKVYFSLIKVLCHKSWHAVYAAPET
jgi:hypothetical protein